MTIRNICRAIVGLSASCAGAGAVASVSFTGTLNATAIAGPSTACAPLPFTSSISPSNSVGQSSLGDFTYGHTTCLAGAVGGPVVGTFFLNFAGDGFQGTINGASSPSGTIGVSNLNLSYQIISGTGRFASGMGSFIGLGTVDTRSPPPRVNLAFNGLVSAVPEPGTWGLMLLGFGAVGWSMRKRRHEAATALPVGG